MAQNGINKVTPEIAAMYWSQKCDVIWLSGGELSGIKVGEVWRDHYINTVIRFVSRGMANIVPHLRRLSSITDEEALGLYNIKFGESVVRNWPSALHWWHDLNGDELWVREAQIGNPRIWLYLLSKGFDLFGLIEQGLAKSV